jgi:hypothetical protein
VIDPQRLTAALVELEERHLEPDCLSDRCDHDVCPEYVIGCRDGAELAAIYNESVQRDGAT